MPTLVQLRYILAVADLKSFNKAAKSCNVSQPSLSSQIKKVETELNILIFDRNTKPILPTKNGEKVILQAKNILLENKKLLDIKQDIGILSGDFHLSCIPSLASYIIPLFISSFSKKYPKVNLKISELKTDDILERLLDNKIDAGLLVTPLLNNKIQEHKIFYERFYVFTSNKHNLYKKKYVTYKDLKSKSIWLLEEGHCLRNQVINVCSINEDYEVYKNINYQSENLETIINLIRNGNGFTLLPELATLSLSSEEKRKNLKSILSPIPTREVSLINSHKYVKIRLLQALKSEILKNLPTNIKTTYNKMSVINI